MGIAITAKSLEAAVCLILLTEKYINKENTEIKNKYSEIREEPTDLEVYTNTFDDYEKTTIYKKRKENIEIYDIYKVGQLYC
jgi:hypothetical protein